MDRGGGRGGGFTPPESPRTGAVRGPSGFAAPDGGHGASGSSHGGEVLILVYAQQLFRVSRGLSNGKIRRFENAIECD